MIGAFCEAGTGVSKTAIGQGKISSEIRWEGKAGVTTDIGSARRSRAAMQPVAWQVFCGPTSEPSSAGKAGPVGLVM